MGNGHAGSVVIAMSMRVEAVLWLVVWFVVVRVVMAGFNRREIAPPPRHVLLWRRVAAPVVRSRSADVEFEETVRVVADAKGRGVPSAFVPVALLVLVFGLLGLWFSRW